MSTDEMTSIYRRYVTMVRHRALHVLRDTHLAEDVAQETFMRFIDYAERHDVQFAGALLYRISTQIAVRRLRSQYENVEIREDTATTPLRGNIEDRLALDKVLSLCNETDAQIATMYYVDGMSQDEIAAVSGIPRRTVCYRLECFCKRAHRLLTATGARASAFDALEQIPPPLSVPTPR